MTDASDSNYYIEALFKSKPKLTELKDIPKVKKS